jgi:ATP-dependent Clp protease ATP-binding subunit ClpC
MTPRTKRIIEGSAMESVRAGQSYIGTEHLLLSLLGERDAVAVQILENLGVAAAELVSEVRALLGASGARGEQPRGGGDKKQNSQLFLVTLHLIL